jgi:Fe-S cluster biogenesis protein NfuA
MADRLSDEEVERRLNELDDLLGRLEQIPGVTATIGLDAVRALTEVYGEALARLMSRLSKVPSECEAAAEDDLIGHLLILHGIHPQPAAERISHALDEIRPLLQSHGGDALLADIADGIAQVRLTGTSGGCSASAGSLEDAVRDAVLAAAPELRDVRPVRDTGHDLPLIPLSQVRIAPARG